MATKHAEHDRRRRRHRVNLTMAPSTIKLAGEIAAHRGVSVSELFERALLAQLGHQVFWTATEPVSG